MKDLKSDRGQSLLELAVILPVLLALLFITAEVGFALRNYILVSNANRVACRFAAQGRYDDQAVAERVVNSGGTVVQGEETVPFLRIEGVNPNTGVIITHVWMDSAGNYDDFVVSCENIKAGSYCSVAFGVIPDGEGGMRDIDAAGDSKVQRAQIAAHHSDVTKEINDLRQAAGLDETDNHIVVVETFFRHQGLTPSFWSTYAMYAQAEMRVTRDQ